MNLSVESSAAHFGRPGGIILAGGRSTRMGCDKALIEWQGKPLIVHVAGALSEAIGEVSVSCEDPAPYTFLGLPCIPDRYPGQGPLAGLHAAFFASHRPWILAVACDMPRVHVCLLRSLIEFAAGWDAVVPRTSDGRIHPLCALYTAACMPALERFLAAGRNQVRGFLAQAGLLIRFVEGSEAGFQDQDLFNVNSPEDMRTLTGLCGPRED